MFDQDRHETCTDKPWDSSLVRDFMTSCVSKDAEFIARQGWKTMEGNGANTTLYEGGLGVLWGIHYVSHALDFDVDFSVSDVAQTIYRDFENFESRTLGQTGVKNFEASYFLGRSGSLNTLQKLDPVRYSDYQQQLIKIAHSNLNNPTLEVLWGGPGSILPILNNLERAPSEQTLSQLFLTQFDCLMDALIEAEDYGCMAWRQDLYGNQVRLSGSGHGFAGNVYPFLRGQDFLPNAKREFLRETTVNTLIKTATVESDLTNWMPSLDGDRPGRPSYLVQWCHGAPGIIMAVNDIPAGYSTELDSLLIKAGELVWTAGPLQKGPGLCHGTDGNGWSFLKLFERTGDELWLQRARAFGVHAMTQYIAKETPIHEFWTGDSSLAPYLFACEHGISRVPLWDFV